MKSNKFNRRDREENLRKIAMHKTDKPVKESDDSPSSACPSVAPTSRGEGGN